MALNFDVSKIKDYQRVTTDPANKSKWHPVTDALIWKTMSVDLGSITEKNIDEWEYRLKVLRLMDGPEFEHHGKKVCLTREDLEMHIGLVTNVTTKSRKQWLARIVDERSIDRALRHLTQEKSAWQIWADSVAEGKA